MSKTIFFLFIVCLFVGCKTVAPLQPAQEIVYRDRVEYVDRYQRDTIYQRDTEHTYTVGDTVYVDRWQYKYKEIVSYDTIYFGTTDSIFIEKSIYIEKPPNKSQKFLMRMGTLFIGILLAIVIRYIYKLII